MKKFVSTLAKRLLLFTGTVMAVSLLASSAFAGTISSAAGQVFVTNDVDTTISTITITEDAGDDINNTDGIRIRIPISMTWDSTDTVVTLTDSTGDAVATGAFTESGAGACAASPCDVAVTFESSNTIMYIPVLNTTNLVNTDAFTITGMEYSNFSADSAADNLDLCIDGDCTAVEATDSNTITISAPTIASSAAQTFYSGQSTQPMDWTLTITEDASDATINTTDDIWIKIPSTLNMAWDPSDTAVSVSGTDYAKVEQAEGGAACAADPCTVTVTYTQNDGSTACTGSDCKVMKIPVETAWSAADDITVTGATLFEFGDISDAAYGLGLEINGTTTSKTASATHSSNQIELLSVTNTSAGDQNGPAAPSSATATQTADGIVITWTDPSDSDLAEIQVLRGVNDFTISGDPYTTVATGVGTYTDTAVEVGSTYKYLIRGVDTSSNTGDNSEELTVTVAEEVPVAESDDEAETNTVTLAEQNESGESGTATMTDSDDGLMVTVAITGVPESLAGVEQPAHIHNGTCEELGDVAYSLTSVVDGASETTIADLTLDDLEDGGPYAINIHESADLIDNYVACGNIVFAEEEDTEAGDSEDDDDSDDTEDETDSSDEDMEDEMDDEDDEVEVDFSDTDTHWAKSQIEDLGEDDIVRGNPDGSFNPDGYINRAEAAALMVRVINNAMSKSEDPAAPSSKPFNDVETSAWYAGYVASLLEKGLVANKDNYYPGDNMNRAEYLQLAVNVYNYLAEEMGMTMVDTDATSGGNYVDLSSSDWYYGTVMGATTAGFVNGSSCDGGTCFKGGDNVTRAEATTILHNMYYTGEWPGF